MHAFTRPQARLAGEQSEGSLPMPPATGRLRAASTDSLRPSATPKEKGGWAQTNGGLTEQQRKDFVMRERLGFHYQNLWVANGKAHCECGAKYSAALLKHGTSMQLPSMEACTHGCLYLTTMVAARCMLHGR